MARLMDYETNGAIREATGAEARASAEAARHDGGAGVIEVDGRRAYVEESIVDDLAGELARVLDADASVEEVDGDLVRVSVDAWPEPVVYRPGAALAVLRECEDGEGADEGGDAAVCRRLEEAGALVR